MDPQRTASHRGANNMTRLPQWFDRVSRRIGAIFAAATNRFMDIDGTQWAGAFAHFAFFALFPLIVLSVSIASAFVDRGAAGGEIIAYVETFIPIDGENQSYIFDTVSGVIAARGQASLLALLLLAWAGLGFFSTLIRATNRAWGLDVHNWWQQPLASLVFLAIMVLAVLASIAVPMLMRMAKAWVSPAHDFQNWVYVSGGFLLPELVVFLVARRQLSLGRTDLSVRDNPLAARAADARAHQAAPARPLGHDARAELHLRASQPRDQGSTTST
jgi:uncharacterized BrkB/YihY/UPF0761 family membrane protein